MLWDKKRGSPPHLGPETAVGWSVTAQELEGTPPLQQPLQKGELMSENPPRDITSTSGSRGQTILGHAVLVKGDLSGKEDLLIEGQCEGTLDFQDHCLTVRPHGQVKSEIRARQVVIQGTVNGKISAKDRVEIRKTGTVVADIVSATVAIEDGAFFKGSIEIVREGRPEATPRAMSALRLGVRG
jgi:cytoskeletal protein CcmA (bactofilin family)